MYWKTNILMKTEVLASSSHCWEREQANQYSEAIMNTDNTLHLNHTFLPEGLEALACEVGRVHGPYFLSGPIGKSKG